MIKEHSMIALSQDLAKHALKAGDVGTVLHVDAKDQAYEVEFLMADGSTLEVLTLKKNLVRPLNKHEIFHVRDIASYAA